MTTICICYKVKPVLGTGSETVPQSPAPVSDLQAGAGTFAELPPSQEKVSEVTHTMTHVSRRDRRRAARKSLAAANAASAGRATAAVLAASGLVISSGVAANAADDTTDGRDSSTVQLNTSQLTVERASHPTVEAVTASDDTELTFDRPAVSSEASPERVAAEEAAAEQESAAEQAAAEQAERDAEAERAAEAQAQQNADAQQAQQEQAQQEQAQPAQQEQAQPAQQEQAQPAQQQSQPTPQADSNSGASPAGGADQQPASSSGGRSGVVGAAYGLIGIPWSQMDCSAMVQSAYASAGISVPRDTYGQMTLPRVSSPAPGDIVISNGGGHAAIYIGNGQVISSTSSQGIRVHGLHEGWHNVNSYHRPG